MTKEQYSKAVAIDKRISDLEEALKVIGEKHSLRLSYAYKNSSGCYSLCPDWSRLLINDILDRHDLAIRKEIQDEIDSLKKEIESL